MNFKNFKITSKGLYWGLIITFAILYICVGFVSTLHSITFFNLANNLGLAILLGLTYEIGQASVLFSILMTKNKEKFLPWALMFLLTALQVTANVYASFKFMVSGGSTDWQYWQKSILFGVQASSPEMYQVIISWISGALLPIVALGMTALVAQNIKMATEEDEKKESIPAEQADEIITNEVEKRVEALKVDPEVEKSIITSADVLDNIEFEKPLPEIPKSYPENHEPQIDLLKDLANKINEERENNDLDEEVKRLSPLQYVGTATDEEVKKMAERQPEVTDNFVSEAGPMEEIVITEPPKKRGRPPRNLHYVAESKKEQEPLQNEEVKVPEKPRRFVDPLKLKGKKIKPVKNLKEFHKPSTGDQIIQIIKNIDKEKDKESIIEETLVKSESSEPIETKSESKPESDFASYIVNGVEVVDVKAIQKAEKKN